MNKVYPSRINWENEDESLNTPINDVNLNKISHNTDLTRFYT